MSNDINEIHSELLVLMDIIDEFCRNNSIHYSLHGGTMLGAVREKGFIPWDDDMDITFTRSEYEKFEKLFSCEATEKKEIQVGFEGGYSPRVFISRENRPRVWIDIYIYDYISSSRFVQKLKFLLLALTIAWSRDSNAMKLTKAHGKYKGLSYFLIWIIHCAGIPFSKRFKDNAASRLCRAFGGEKKLIHRANDQYVALKMILDSEYMKEYEDILFENRNYMITRNYHEVLVSSYGNDYMTPKRYDCDIASHDLFRKQIEKSE